MNIAWLKWLVKDSIWSPATAATNNKLVYINWMPISTFCRWHNCIFRMHHQNGHSTHRPSHSSCYISCMDLPANETPSTALASPETQFSSPHISIGHHFFASVRKTECLNVINSMTMMMMMSFFLCFVVAVRKRIHDDWSGHAASINRVLITTYTRAITF